MSSARTHAPTEHEWIETTTYADPAGVSVLVCAVCGAERVERAGCAPTHARDDARATRAHEDS